MVEEFNTLYEVIFFTMAGLLLVLESTGARWRESQAGGSRWTSNIGLLVLGSVISGLVVPIGMVGFTSVQPPGLMTRHGWPMALQIVATFLALDLWQYWQHRLYHQVPLLWRAHLVHHSDTRIDVTTAERHHPFELVASTALTMLLIFALGLPAVGVAVYLLSATVVGLCSHANLRPPLALDRFMRKLIVTPPLHAVHHSEFIAQTNSNYASVLPVWDLLFGTYVDPEDSPVTRFGLEYFHEPRDTSLGRVLLQPFLFRRLTHYPPRASMQDAAWSPAAPPSDLERHWNTVLAWGLCGVILSALALWPTVLDLAGLWASNESYRYGWLVLPMLAYLLGSHHRREILSLMPQPGRAGVLLAVAGALLWGAALVMNLGVGGHLALVLVLLGVAMACLGWHAFRRFFPALGLLIFMVPAGDVLQPVLRWITVRSIELLAVVAGLPHQIDGYIVHIGSVRYLVAEECTGLTSVILASFICYSLGCLLYRSFWRVTAFAVLGALLGVFMNALRVDAIVLIDWVRGTQMSLNSHGPFQWAALLLTLGLVLLTLHWLPVEPVGLPRSVRPGPRPASSACKAPLLAGLAGLAVLIIAGGVRMQAADQPYRRETAVPALQDIQGWQLTAGPATWTVDPADQSEAITLAYARDNQVMRIRVVRALATGAKLSGSDFAPGPRDVWDQSAMQKNLACTGSHCVALLHATWQRSRGKGRVRYQAFYNYGIGPWVTNSTLLARAAQGWRRIAGNVDAPEMVGLLFETDVPAGMDLAAVFETVRAAMNASQPK
jgi:exosortase